MIDIDALSQQLQDLINARTLAEINANDVYLQWKLRRTVEEADLLKETHNLYESLARNYTQRIFAIEQIIESAIGDA